MQRVKIPDSFDDCYGGRFVDDCRAIRRLATAGRIDIGFEGGIGSDFHLVKLLESCGVSIRAFIQGYLGVLQPYSLEFFWQSNTDTWLIILGYRTEMVLELCENSNGQYLSLVLSERHLLRSGEMLTRSLDKEDFVDKPCAVLIDRKGFPSGAVGNLRTEVAFIVQRSFIRSNIKARVKDIQNGVALVEYKMIRDVYQDKLSEILNDLQSTYENGDIVREITPDFKDVAFLSNGYSAVNYICLLLDCFGVLSKGQNVIIELVNNILSEMPVESASELIATLIRRYGVNYSNALYQQVISICDNGGLQCTVI